MIVAVVILVAFCVLSYLQTRAFNEERRDWTRERASLLSRIQHPQVVQMPPELVDEISPLAEVVQFPGGEDEIERVGTILGGTDAD